MSELHRNWRCLSLLLVLLLAGCFDIDGSGLHAEQSAVPDRLLGRWVTPDGTALIEFSRYADDKRMARIREFTLKNDAVDLETTLAIVTALGRDRYAIQTLDHGSLRPSIYLLHLSGDAIRPASIEWRFVEAIRREVPRIWNMQMDDQRTLSTRASTGGAAVAEMLALLSADARIEELDEPAYLRAPLPRHFDPRRLDALARAFDRDASVTIERVDQAMRAHERIVAPVSEAHLHGYPRSAAWIRYLRNAQHGSAAGLSPHDDPELAYASELPEALFATASFGDPEGMRMLSEYYARRRVPGVTPARAFQLSLYWSQRSRLALDRRSGVR
ncbi:MAG: hypothetical protein AB7G13_05505 [Lautropia sp.]